MIIHIPAEIVGRGLLNNAGAMRAHHGHMVFEGSPDDLRRNKLVRQEWLEV